MGRPSRISWNLRCHDISLPIARLSLEQFRRNIRLALSCSRKGSANRVHMAVLGLSATCRQKTDGARHFLSSENSFQLRARHYLKPHKGLARQLSRKDPKRWKLKQVNVQEVTGPLLGLSPLIATKVWDDLDFLPNFRPNAVFSCLSASPHLPFGKMHYLWTTVMCATTQLS